MPQYLKLALISGAAGLLSQVLMTPVTARAAGLTISSPAFSDGGQIPAKYTCTGSNLSPPLKWEGVPSNAHSIALIMDDPDAPAGTFVHWVVYNLPAKTTELPEDVEKKPVVTGGGQQGLNNLQKYGYFGPCPPPGKDHHYRFKLYALDESITANSATAQQLEQAMNGHILAQATMVGIFKR